MAANGILNVAKSNFKDWNVSLTPSVFKCLQHTLRNVSIIDTNVSCINNSIFGKGGGFERDLDFLNFINSLLNPSNLLPEPLPHNIVITFVVLYSLIIILAVVGNVIVIAVIGKHRLRRSVTDMYIFSLAISDLLIATLNMPFQMYFIIANEWIADGVTGEALCKFTNYVQGVTIVACVLTLTAIAIDRYIVICRPSISRRIHSNKSAITGIVIVWILALCALSPHLVFQKLDKRLKLSKHEIGVGWVCAEFYPRGKRDGQLYSVFVYICLYCIPVLIMTYTYGAIAHRLWFRKPIFPAAISSGQHARSVAHKKKITKLLIVLVLAFTILWLPFFTFSIYSEFAEDSVHSFRIKMAVLQLVGYSNCCVNPITYTFLNNSFQKEFLRRCRCACLIQGKPVPSSLKTETESRL